MTYLTSHLPFPSSSSSSSSASSSASTSTLPPPSSHLIISDTLPSPGDFALYHLTSAALSKEKRKVIWVDFRAEGRGSLESVLKKLGTPLPPTTNSQLFIAISPSSLPPSVATTSSAPATTSSSNTISPRLYTDSSSQPQPSLSLTETYDCISAKLEAGSMVILDGLSELLWMGMSATDVARFVRAVFARTRSTKSTLVSTLHGDTLPLTSSASAGGVNNADGDADRELLERLLRIGQGTFWRICHLASGRSGDVMGEISSHPLSLPPPASLGSQSQDASATTPSSLPNSQNQILGQTKASYYPSVPRCNPLQYRIEPSTVRVFPKGTGRGFL
ncbi:hypothetical protein I317_00966 [Kwoniella heveanensis CBS 569]|nr:hypothetical protein I317_00966 [Kwoniella heveanensis CBS 569]